VEAVDADRFLLKEIDQWVDITLQSFGPSTSTTATTLSTISGDYAGDFEYDPGSSRIYFGNSGISSPEIHVFQISGNTLVAKEATVTYGSAEIGGGSSVLSSDWKFFFYGALEVDAFSVRTNIRKLPEIIYADASGIAFGASSYYNQQTGDRLGSIPFASTIYSATDAKHELWAFNSSTLSLERFSIPAYGAGVLANDSDAEQDLLTATLVDGPAHGTLSLQALGGFIYVPNAGFAGTDTFTYTAGAGTNTSNLATVSIRVNQHPVAQSNAYTTAEDQPLAVDVAQGVLANDVDPEGDALTGRLISAPAFGVLTLLPNGSFTYAPSANFAGSDSFTYVASDGLADSQPVTVQLTVTPINDAPLAADDGYRVTQNQALVVGSPAGVLTNDYDVEGTSLSAVIAHNVEHGQLALAADGSFSYTPDADFVGIDTFTYQASDGQALSSVAAVNLYVYGPNLRPVSADDTYSMDSGATLTVGAAKPSAASFASLTELNSITAHAQPTQLEYSSPYNLLFVREGNSRIHVLDAQTKTEISVDSARETFTDFDVSPSGRYLYVADYGGTNIGYGTPLRPSFVHRYDAATRTWETRQVSGVAYQVEGVDDDRFLLKSIDQWTSISLNSFGGSNATSATSLATIGGDYGGDFEYDATSQRIYLGNSGSSSREIHVYQIVGNGLVGRESTSTYGSASQGGGSSVLSSNGQYFFYGGLQVDAFDVRTNVRTLPEIIRSANGQIAFGTNAFYSTATGQLLGHLPSPNAIYAMSDDGGTVWTFDSQADTYRRYSFKDITQGVLQNDVDPENDAVTAAVVSGPSHGALSFATNGSFQYTPSPGFEGQDTFTYAISDTTGAGNIASVTIDVLLNHAPVNQLPATARLVMNEKLSFSSGPTIQVTDVDNPPLIDVVLNADHAALSVRADFAGVVDGNDSQQLHLRGEIAAVNAALAALVLEPENDYLGDIALQMTCNDLTAPSPLNDSDQMVITTYEAPWHNVSMPDDVNDDGRITATDALAIVSDLLTNGARQVIVNSAAVQPLAESAAAKYLDVNGDNRVTAMDALRVINQLLHPVVVLDASPATADAASTGAESAASAIAFAPTTVAMASAAHVLVSQSASTLMDGASPIQLAPTTLGLVSCALSDSPSQRAEDSGEDSPLDADAQAELDSALAQILGR
jgi:hypothetical protein